MNWRRLPGNFNWVSAQQLTQGLLIVGKSLRAGQSPGEPGGDKAMLLKSDGGIVFAPLTVSRFNPKTVLLTDGTMLVVGGKTADSSIAGGIRYTAATELVEVRGDEVLVTRLPDLPGKLRWGFELVALADGRALAVGGTTSTYYCDGCVSDAWIFDPKMRQWQASAQMKTARTAFSASLLADGRVLVAGGWSPRGRHAEQLVEVFDPLRGMWEDFPNLPAAVRGHRAIWLAGEKGKTLVIGGGSNASIQTLDVARRVWSIVGEVNSTRQALFTYRDDSDHPWAFLFGGNYSEKTQNPITHVSNERIALRSQQIASTQFGVYQWMRSDFALATRADGSVFLAGGWIDDLPHGVATGSVDRLAVGQSIPVAMAGLNHPRGGRSVSIFPMDDDRIIVAGGRWTGYSDRTEGTELPMEWYDPEKERWSEVIDSRTGQAMRGTKGAALSQFPSGDLLEVSADAVYRINLVGGQAAREVLPSLNRRREEGVARVLADGHIVVAGGNVQAENIAVVESPRRNQAERSDDAKRSPRLLAEVIHDKYEGFGPVLPSRRHEIFDPVTRRWTNSSPSRMAGGNAAIMDDGRVVKVGELMPGILKNDIWIPARLLIEQSTNDGANWQTLPLPDGLSSNGAETWPIVQSGELFLRGLVGEKAMMALWWYDASSREWLKLIAKDGYFNELLTIEIRNGKRLVWGWRWR